METRKAITVTVASFQEETKSFWRNLWNETKVFYQNTGWTEGICTKNCVWSESKICSIDDEAPESMIRTALA